MDIESGKRIYLDRTASETLYEPDDWELMESGHFIRHLPSHLIFEIDLDEQVPRDSKTASVCDFYSCPVHLCSGHAMPDEAELVFLGRGAIVVYLQRIGAWKPLVFEVSDDVPF